MSIWERGWSREGVGYSVKQKKRVKTRWVTRRDYIEILLIPKLLPQSAKKGAILLLLQGAALSVCLSLRLSVCVSVWVV